METMRTITFEDGTKYAVNAPIVEVSGELTEAGTNIDFGTFENGLTEVELISNGVTGTSGDYFFVTINGIQTNFISYASIYSGNMNLRMKKIGNLWTATGTTAAGNLIQYVTKILNSNNVDKITDVSIQSYSSSTPFAVGHKYALEGR